MQRIRDYLLALFCIIIWGITFINTKILLESFSAFEIQFVRFLLAYIALWGICPKRGKVRRGDEWIFAVMGFSGVFVYQFLENCAIHYTNASNVSIIVAICPLVTAIMMRLFGGAKPLSLWFFVGFIIAFLGVILVSLNGITKFHFEPIGDFIAVCAMIAWGVYSVMVSKGNMRGYSPVLMARRAFFWALIFMFPLFILGAFLHIEILYVRFDFARYFTLKSLVNIGFLGLLASATSFALWNLSLRRIGTVRCSLCLYLIPVITVLVAYLVLGEVMTWASCVGSVLILIGVFVSSM